MERVWYDPNTIQPKHCRWPNPTTPFHKQLGLGFLVMQGLINLRASIQSKAKSSLASQELAGHTSCPIKHAPNLSLFLAKSAQHQIVVHHFNSKLMG
jgi:hypothetical protein